MRADGTAGVDSLIHRVTDQAIDFLTNEVGLYAAENADYGTPAPPRLTSTLRITGAMDGQIYLTASQTTVSVILQGMLGDSVADSEIPAMLEDTLCEVLNMIVGNTCRGLDEDGLRISLHPPALMCPADGGQRDGFPTEPVQRRVLLTSSGPLVLGYWDNLAHPREDS